MIAPVSERIASFIAANDKNAASKEVLVYGISTFLHTVLTGIVIIVTCLLTGHFAEMLWVMLYFTILRFFSGGVHLHSAWKCDISSALTIIALAHLSIPYYYAGFVLNSLAFVIVAVKAPEKPNLNYSFVAKHQDKLKWISLAIVATNFAFQSPFGSLALLYQSLTLTKPFYKLFDFIDRR
ncbi:accessory gene regulator ArgB-like protein [Paenibacillus thermotolerans]|uniref:accessory gene regulator ArgB-like protein n=1 Tax=Paenibacillus thermotolerans TaxID=3027807 RepID=UPI002367DE6C|nr:MULTISPECIES: accessory gene regulator B family protein [unclassified Paenibacillus]